MAAPACTMPSSVIVADGWLPSWSNFIPYQWFSGCERNRHSMRRRLRCGLTVFHVNTAVPVTVVAC